MKQYVASHLKNMNRQMVYRLLRGTEKTSKAEIARVTGISAPTVSKIIDYFKEQDLIIELGEGENLLGRKPLEICLNSERMYCASFFYEGSFLQMGLVNILGQAVYQRTIQKSIALDELMRRIGDEYIPELFSEAGIDIEKLSGIGIALPAMYDPAKNTISGGTVMNGEAEISMQAYRERLESRYHVRVYFENDVNAQALGEFQNERYGMEDDLVLISIGTGVGSGVILNGTLRRGYHNMCGEIGYFVHDFSFTTYKNEVGWLEKKIGYRSIEEHFDVRFFDEDHKGGVKLDSEKRAEIIREIVPELAICISNISVFLDCGNIVLGGKMAEALGDGLILALNRELVRICLEPLKVRSESSPDIGLIGASSGLMALCVEEILTEG